VPMDANELGRFRPLGSRPRGIPIGWGCQVVLGSSRGKRESCKRRSRNYAVGTWVENLGDVCDEDS
jgi:hypothetical protein